MKIFNQTTLSFACRCEKWLKVILIKEAGLEVGRTRFKLNGYTYPIHIIVFENDSQLGWFDPHTYQIGINIKLMYSGKDQVIQDILRHELAHYFSFIEGAADETAHGPKFQSICERYGWGKLVSHASFNLNEQELHYQYERKDKLLNKIKNLLKLAESDNPHKAELATLKANQLLLKHNLAHLEKGDWSLYSQTVLSAPKRNAKLSAIYDILKHFLVQPVFIYGRKQVFLEVSGSRENIELAEYIAGFLDQKFEDLWRQQNDLKGLKAKNAFYLGIARGYEQKVKKSFSEHKNQLMVLQNQLQEKIKLAHRRLSSSTHSRSQDAEAFSRGQNQGRGLVINQAIKNTLKTRFITKGD